jgi:hypothetical protein
LAKLFIEERTKRIVIAADIRGSLKCYNPGAMGNYSTAFSVELKKFDDDLFKTARQVHETVRKYLAGLHPFILHYNIMQLVIHGLP